MIKANELRIGNLLNNGTVVRLAENYARIAYQYDGMPKQSCVDYEHLEPIPLIEEWLIKCGFKFQNILKKAYQRNLYLYKGFGIYEVKPKEFFYKEIQIKYVHQLQNLYFVLTGEELEINL